MINVAMYSFNFFSACRIQNLLGMDSPTKGDEGEGQMSPPMKRFFHQVSSQSDNPTKITIKTRVMDDNNGHTTNHTHTNTQQQ